MPTFFRSWKYHKKFLFSAQIVFLLFLHPQKTPCKGFLEDINDLSLLYGSWKMVQPLDIDSSDRSSQTQAKLGEIYRILYLSINTKEFKNWSFNVALPYSIVKVTSAEMSDTSTITRSGFTGWIINAKYHMKLLSWEFGFELPGWYEISDDLIWIGAGSLVLGNKISLNYYLSGLKMGGGIEHYYKNYWQDSMVKKGGWESGVKMYSTLVRPIGNFGIMVNFSLKKLAFLQKVPILKEENQLQYYDIFGSLVENVFVLEDGNLVNTNNQLLNDQYNLVLVDGYGNEFSFSDLTGGVFFSKRLFRSSKFAFGINRTIYRKHAPVGFSLWMQYKYYLQLQ